ncbi:hypothetical protein A4A49_37398 [Nicotiana attenuata]|uniref:Uncharacterized protein n=1 Tax=Nicotiana attenuata TaxID=49451 RepID=A0A1J6JVS1_NICAT|nr:hypothetical protein A4A49_37398 [Nicotiana attenuata]
MKWTKLARTGAIEAEFMGVDAVGEKYIGDLRLFLKEKRALKEGDGRVGEQINPTATTQASKSHQGDHEYAKNPFKTSHVATVASTAIVPVETTFARFSLDVAVVGQSNSCPVSMDNVVLMRNKSEAVQNLEKSKVEFAHEKAKAGATDGDLPTVTLGKTTDKSIGVEAKDATQLIANQSIAGAQTTLLKDGSEQVVQKEDSQADAEPKSDKEDREIALQAENFSSNGETAG